MHRFFPLVLLGFFLAACGPGRDPVLNSGDPTLLLSQGRAAFDTGEYARAEELLRQSLEEQPTNNRAALVLLGRVRLAQGELEEAISLLEEVLVSEPENLDALFNLGVARYEQGEVAQAIDLFERARAQSPEDAELLYNLGSAYAQEEQYETAIGLYQQSVAISPTLPLPYFGLGTLYQVTGQNDLAAEAFNQFLALSEDPDLRERAQTMLTQLQGE